MTISIVQKTTTLSDFLSNVYPSKEHLKSFSKQETDLYVYLLNQMDVVPVDFIFVSNGKQIEPIGVSKETISVLSFVNKKYNFGEKIVNYKVIEPVAPITIDNSSSILKSLLMTILTTCPNVEYKREQFMTPIILDIVKQVIDFEFSAMNTTFEQEMQKLSNPLTMEQFWETFVATHLVFVEVEPVFHKNTITNYKLLELCFDKLSTIPEQLSMFNWFERYQKREQFVNKINELNISVSNKTLDIDLFDSVVNYKYKDLIFCKRDVVDFFMKNGLTEEAIKQLNIELKYLQNKRKDVFQSFSSAFVRILRNQINNDFSFELSKDIL